MSPQDADGTPSPVLDAAVVKQLQDLGGSILERVVGVFLTSTPKHLAELRAQAAAGDAEAVGRIAHSVKGSSGNLGARRLSMLLRQLEHNPDGEIAALIDAIEDEYRQVAAEFDRILGPQP